MDVNFSALSIRCSTKAEIEYVIREVAPAIAEIVPAADPMRTPLVRYFSLLYSANSPLRQRYRDLDTRQQAAKEIAGLDDSDRVRYDEVRTLAMSYHRIASQMIRYQNSRSLALISASEATFWEMVEHAHKPVFDPKVKDLLNALQVKAKMLEIMAEQDAKLDMLYKQLYDDEPVLLQQVQTVRFTPEAIAAAKG